MDKLSILYALDPNTTTTKTWRKDGSVDDYRAGMWFKHEYAKISGVADMHALLCRVENNPKALVIRGALLDGKTPARVRRTYKEDAYFEDQPLHLFCIAVDKFTPLVYAPVLEPGLARDEYLDRMFPDGSFNGVSYAWQLSSSAGHAKNAGVLKAHVWFWSSVAYTSEQMKAWSAKHSKYVDISLYTPAQPHYVARPRFEKGVSDPVPQRCGLVDGRPSVVLSLAPAEIAAATPSRKSKASAILEAHETEPTAKFLFDHGMVKGLQRGGEVLNIVCPFEDEHSSTNDSPGDSSTIYNLANTGLYALGHFKCLHGSCEASKEANPASRSDDAFRVKMGMLLDSLADFEVLADEAPSATEEPKAVRFQPIHGDEFAQLVATEWIIKGVLPKAELGIVFGESGSGKTFKVLDIAMAVATGTEWRQRAVTQGAVVYIAAEGTGGFKKRLRSYAQHHGLDLAAVPLYVIPAAPNLLQKADALDVAKAILTLGVKTSLVIIDTLAQTTAGGNENSGEDMGLALSHCKGIHKATGAMVLLVHHSGKDTSKGARGWSGLRAACDVELEVTRFEQERILALTKQKDGDDMLEFGFKLTTVSLGFDSDGDEITSCVTEPIDGTQRKARGTVKKTGQNERLVLRIMGEMMSGEGEGAQVGRLIDLVAAQILPPDRGGKDRRREMAHRAIQALQDTKRVAVNEHGALFMIEEE